MIAPPFTHAITHGHGAMRRDGDIAPYRHYARKNRTRITHAPSPVGAPDSRRRASARCAAWHPAPSPVAARHRGAWLGTMRLGGAPRWGAGVIGRRALRGPGAPAGGRGRTETPPTKLSAYATCHYTRNIRTAITHAKFARALPTRHRPWGLPTPHSTLAHCPPPCVLVL